MHDAEVRWHLQAVSGPVLQASFSLPLGHRLVAGRAADSAIRLAPGDGHASRYHAAFEATDDGVRVVDLDSRNGLWVNGELERIAFLRHGDHLRIGEAIYRVVDVAPRAPAPVELSIHPPAQPPSWRDARQAPSAYVCEVCGEAGPMPGLDHEPWWREVAWICGPCADRRRTSPDVWPDAIPERVGELEILRFLARGATASVFEARHARAGCRVALKVILAERRIDASTVKRFLKEQRIASELVHPAIVRCFEVGALPATHAHDRRPYVATELLARGDADALAGPASDGRAMCALVADLFDALAHAHAQGVVHRDVKPSNLLLAPPGNDGTPHAKLADFGLAKQYRSIGGTLVTKEHEVGGSAAFVAPEQLLGFRDVGPSADVYGGAATLYYLLTGELPVVLPRSWQDATDPQLCLAALADERVPITERRRVHPWLAQWIDLLVCRDPARRAHVHPAEVAAALRAAPW